METVMRKRGEATTRDVVVKDARQHEITTPTANT
jgi:hypothetical protein